MKLRNKKTGEIGNLLPYGCGDGKMWVWVGNISRPEYRYNSLAELNEEWEDYEEPKDFWYIDDFMIMCGDEGEFTKPELGSFTKKDIEKLKQIGNYFETKEEAEKAVEKLKAWKRLKDKGFRFCGVTETSLGMDCIRFEIGEDSYEEQSTRDSELNKDLRLLFGGEE